MSTPRRILGIDPGLAIAGYGVLEFSQPRPILCEAGIIRTFDIGIIPDPKNDFNDKISMNKVFEYSALGVPSVAYDLAETRRLLGATGCQTPGRRPAP